VRLSSQKVACSSVVPPTSTGNPGSVYTNRETALWRQTHNLGYRPKKCKRISGTAGRGTACPRRGGVVGEKGGYYFSSAASSSDRGPLRYGFSKLGRPGYPQKAVPQRLKPRTALSFYGTTKAVPFLRNSFRPPSIGTLTFRCGRSRVLP
jgi:hypothetical protein